MPAVADPSLPARLPVPRCGQLPGQVRAVVTAPAAVDGSGGTHGRSAGSGRAEGAGGGNPTLRTAPAAGLAPGTHGEAGQTEARAAAARGRGGGGGQGQGRCPPR